MKSKEFDYRFVRRDSPFYIGHNFALNICENKNHELTVGTGGLYSDRDDEDYLKFTMTKAGKLKFSGVKSETFIAFRKKLSDMSYKVYNPDQFLYKEEYKKLIDDDLYDMYEDYKDKDSYYDHHFYSWLIGNDFEMKL